MPNTFTPTTNALAIPTVIAQEVIRKLPGYMNLARTVAKDSDFEQAFSYGDTLRITKTGTLTALQKTPGTAITLQNPNLTNVDVVLNQHWYVAFLQEDITKMLQKPQLQEAYANDAAIALAEKIEGVILALHPSMTNSDKFDASSATTIDASLRRIRSFFARQKVPQAEQKFAYLDTSIIDAMLGVDKYTLLQNVGSERPITEGAIRRIYGIDVFESQLIPTTGSPVAYHSVAYTRGGICLAVRPMALDGNGRGARQAYFNDPNTGVSLRMTESYDTDNFGVKMSMDVLFGAALVDQRRVLEVESF